MPYLVCLNAPKRDTGGHILTEWPFCHVKSAIEHKRRYAHLRSSVRVFESWGGLSPVTVVFFWQNLGVLFVKTVAVFQDDNLIYYVIGAYNGED